MWEWFLLATQRGQRPGLCRSAWMLRQRLYVACVPSSVLGISNQSWHFFLLHSDIASILFPSSQQPPLTAASDLCLWAPLPLTYKNLVPAGDLVAWELDNGICISLILCPNLAFAYSFSYSAVNRCLLHAESIVLGDGYEHGTAFRLIDVHI